MAGNVQVIIDGAKTRVTDLLAETQRTQDLVRANLAAWNTTIPEQVFVFDPIREPDAVVPPTSVLSGITEPTFRSDITLELPSPELAQMEPFQDITALDKGEGPPKFTKSAPTYSQAEFNKPNQLREVGFTPPVLNLDVGFPTMPTYLTAPPGEVPTITDRPAPSAPEVIIPSFAGNSPTGAPVAPTDITARFTAAYADASPSLVTAVNGYIDAEMAKINPQYAAQMAAIEAQLTKYLAGGTGLNSAVEDAIYERSRSKNNAEANRVRDAAWGDAAARGFTLPTGALMSSMQTARQAAADNNAAAAREIVVMQAEMEQKNLQFAVTTSAGIRQAVVSATLAYIGHVLTANGQALDYAKSILGSLVQMYNLEVEAFRVKLDVYKAETAVYEARMKGALMGVEIYKAEIDALLALTNVDKARVDAYQAKVQAYGMLANVYKIQVDAAVSKASMEKLKIDVFQAVVQAYGAQVQAKNSEWAGYQAQIEGKLGEFKGYQAEVDGFKAKAESYNLFLEAQAKSNQAEAAANAARATSFEAQAKAYITHLEANKSKMDGEFQLERNKLTAFQGKVELAKAKSDENFKYYSINYQYRLENAKFKMEFQNLKAAIEKDYRGVQAQTLSADMKVYGQLASSAMAGLNVLASEQKTE